MKLFALTLVKTSESAAHRLYTAVDHTARSFQKHTVATTLHRLDNGFVIQADGILPHFQLDKRTDALYKQVADVLADWIVREDEERLMRTLITRDFDYTKEEDIRAILSYCLPMQQTDMADESMSQMADRRKQIIAEAAYTYLQENSDMHLQGFMNFRLRPYIEELHEMAEYAIDEFLMDQQYQEFISLLKYFVYIQEAKIPAAHLLHKGGNDFLLLNDRMEPIDTSQNDATLTVEMLEKDINFEDVIVSTLISVSPQHIFIHTRDPEVQVIKTIMQIFENRVQLCDYCRVCHNLDRIAAADYNKG
ncbi:putative sporulation protein YtxC [Paenibacillus sp. H1-7]|uniref:putative sporulation protein YtxC n=1 Tax=Paenibacillus sp. H1-7 TaxID=2282849 RepID=UPI001EF87CED|nr:putative sporulation protein YtxC [Paenibacillus sp. H1-7]ULL14207.1 putative sporulation protein YtxC [Paenibacillus sp. H1-7]